MSESHWKIAFEVSESSLTTNTPLPINLFHDCWARLHRNKIHTLEWLAEWRRSLPPNGCNCNYDEALEKVPVRLNDWFRWSVDLHNWVNINKTFKPSVSYTNAERIWIPDERRLLAVTSLSPLDCHRVQQRDAMESWRKIGLDIVSVNLASEIDDLLLAYPEVQFCHGEPSQKKGNPTPTINSMLDHGYSRKILLINSDCSLEQASKHLTAPSVLLRHNWKGDKRVVKREQWGLDAFVLTPDLVRTIPRIPFGIGQPMWDYWIAWHLEQHCELNWVGDPIMFHKAHKLNWEPKDSAIGRDWVRDHYKVDIDWESWRESRPYAYSEYSTTRNLQVQKSEWESIPF